MMRNKKKFKKTNMTKSGKIQKKQIFKITITFQPRFSKNVDILAWPVVLPLHGPGIIIDRVNFFVCLFEYKKKKTYHQSMLIDIQYDQNSGDHFD